MHNKYKTLYATKLVSVLIQYMVTKVTTVNTLAKIKGLVHFNNVFCNMIDRNVANDMMAHPIQVHT